MNGSICDYIYIIIIFVFLVIGEILIRKIFGTINENFTINDQVSAEALNNISSIYNTTNMKVGNLSANGSLSVNGTTELNGTFNLLPKGCIIMWYGNTAPSGWVLCDGQNGTPDLRGRFVLGSGSGSGLTQRTLNQTGGEESHMLSIDEMPSHQHQSGGGITSDMGGGRFGGIIIRERTGIMTDNTGGNQKHNNMPPFFVLSFIMKI